MLHGQVEYQKQFVQEKGHKISVADDPETLRARRNTQNQSQVVYSGQQQVRETSELNRPPAEDSMGKLMEIVPFKLLLNCPNYV